MKDLTTKAETLEPQPMTSSWLAVALPIFRNEPTVTYLRQLQGPLAQLPGHAPLRYAALHS
ncbi:hypothetical protein [Deinococcus ruber]|uniref:Uncharacterized protein n=1 Tax=Deinococcus ruber TaxID=1848197 RepID=A0A918KX20_9DEIO|nr:hypothetical protein [Deinococcus ruber]GGR38290.1 hypothetical protein GCM10008957_54320 [Deinococcus ruber]